MLGSQFMLVVISSTQTAGNVNDSHLHGMVAEHVQIEFRLVRCHGQIIMCHIFSWEAWKANASYWCLGVFHTLQWISMEWIVIFSEVFPN